MISDYVLVETVVGLTERHFSKKKKKKNFELHYSNYGTLFIIIHYLKKGKFLIKILAHEPLEGIKFPTSKS